MNAQSKHVLIVLTSHGTLGDTDKTTGLQLVSWLSRTKRCGMPAIA
jgi:hypothetical protein